MDKKAFMALTVLFMIFVGFQFAEPAAAVKVVDHGTKYGWSGQDDAWVKVTWKTYQYNNNFLKIYRTFYYYNHKTKKYNPRLPDTFTLAKVTKSNVKITDKTNQNELGPDTSVDYRKTKLTAARYYWRVFRHEITVI